MTQSQSSVIKSFFIFLLSEISNSKPGGDGWSRQTNTNAFISLNICMTQNPSSVIRFSSLVFFFNHLKSVITNLGWTEGTHPLNTFVRWDTNASVSPNYCMTQSQSFIIKFSSFIFSTT